MLTNIYLRLCRNQQTSVFATTEPPPSPTKKALFFIEGELREHTPESHRGRVVIGSRHSEKVMNGI
ncbi:MAG: hypothetical protein ACFFB5_11820 [Promethearchaeota archaeon]